MSSTRSALEPEPRRVLTGAEAACVLRVAVVRGIVDVTTPPGPGHAVEEVELRWSLAVNREDPSAARESLSAAELVDVPDIVLSA